MNKPTLIERVMARLQGGDNAKVTRFVTKEAKYLDKKIKEKKDVIDHLKDKLVDAKENLEEVVEIINVDRINDTDSQESYCDTYTNNVIAAMDNIESLEDQIETKEAEIAKLEKIQSTIFGTSSKKKAVEAPVA